MRTRTKILIGAIFLITFSFFAQPPAPGDPVEEPVSIDQGIIILFIAGVLLGLYIISKKIKSLPKKHGSNFKNYTKSVHQESSKKIIRHNLK